MCKMLIWGSKWKEKEPAQGQFLCPKCNALRPYQQKRVLKYSIPLFETKNLGEFVECQVCKSGFDPKILEPNSQTIFQLVTTTRQALLHGVSPAAVRSELIGVGVGAQGAEDIIRMAERSPIRALH